MVIHQKQKGGQIAYIVAGLILCNGFFTSHSASIHGVTPNKGSLNGETRLTIDGSGFSFDQYNNGNTVKLVSSTNEANCTVHKDGTNEKQIMCYTPQGLVADNYYIRVAVDGNDVPLNDHCGGNAFSGDCRFTATLSSTPTITKVEPVTQSSLPGEIYKLYGKIFSGIYGSNVPSDEITNGVTERILRVYANAQLCKLRGENDTFYGLELDSDGTSKMGYMKCLTQGTFVGNTNASFILEGEYGRSLPDMDILRVSRDDQIYMFQTYAKITGINPSSGSVKGGTLITISGQYFDETNAPATVMIGGSKCEVVGNITDTEIVCKTPGQVTANSYSGNRGLNFEEFSSTYYSYNDLTNAWDLFTNATDYTTSVIDDFSFTETVKDEYTTRTHGYFVPPHTGVYSFHIICDDSARLYLSTDEDPANKVEIASCPSYTTKWFSKSVQMSSRMNLVKDKHYYIEALHSEKTVGSSIKVAARHLDTKFTSSMTGLAESEKQKIQVKSDVDKEIQQVTVTNLNSGTATKEVQEVTIEENSGRISDATYQLGLYGVYTTPLQTTADGTAIGTALSDLPFFDSTESVTVSSTTLSTGAPGAKLTVTFNSERGDFPKLDVKTSRGTGGESLTVRVTEKKAGVPSGKYFTLSMESVPTPLIVAAATASNVKTALESLFGTRCQKFLTSPVAKNKFYDFESALPGGVGGSKTNEVEPFCGRYVVRNPSSLYRETNSKSNGIKLSSSVSVLCFAYQGNQIQNYIRLSYAYEDAAEEIQTSATNIQVTFETTEGWHYLCIDMLDELKAKRSGVTYFWVSRIQVYKIGSADQFYIDDVYIGREALISNTTDINQYRMVSAKPNKALIKTVSVSSPSAGVYDITLEPHECGFNFPLFSKISGQVRAGASISVSRTQAASPPITGTLTVSFKNKTKSGIPYDLNAADLKTTLQTIEGIGNIDVVRTGTCANFDITITYSSLPGDQPQIEVDSSRLNGNNVVVTVTTVEDGGLWYSPIPGDMLRTDHDVPQVMALINKIPTVCDGVCTFEWVSSMSPTITAINPTSGASGSSVVITGTNLGPLAADNRISIGGVLCTPTSGSTTSVTCTLGQGSYGTYLVEVDVDGKGTASHDGGNVNFQYTMSISGISPTTGALGGGIPLTITGNGFSKSADVTIGGNTCEVDSATATPTQIVCDLPSSTAGTVDVNVTIAGHTQTSPTQFTYDGSLTPTITSVSPATSGAAGGATLTIDGTNFGTSGTLKIGSTVVPTATFTDTQVTATLPSLPAGTYEIRLIKGNGGAAVNSQGSIPTIEYQLIITNVFPTKGSIHGGTRLTLTGQGFSSNASDVRVKVGAYNCGVESSSSTEITCLIQDTATVIEIDNQGVNPTWGKGYQWNPVVAKAKVGDIIQWSWSTPSWIKSFTHSVIQTLNETSTEAATGGFKSGSAGTANGQFRYRVTTPGEFSYWSGYCDTYEIVYYRGTLIVEDRSSFTGEIQLKVAGQTALHNTNSGVANPTDSSACPGTTSSISTCSPATALSARFTFAFESCHTAAVTAIDKTQGTTTDTITLTGYGFSTTKCQNEVKFGDGNCLVTHSTDSSIKCTIDESNNPTIGLMQDISLRVNNLGDANIAIAGQAARSFVLVPVVTAISPQSSSLNGGLDLTITGSGYQGSQSDIQVTINGLECPIKSVSYTEITCVTPASRAGIKSIEVKVSANGNMIPAVCDVVCQIVYEPANTPKVTDINPKTLDGSSTTLTLTGTGFASGAGNIFIDIGGETCSPSPVSDTQMSCTITNAPAGSQDVNVVISDKGKATNSIKVTSSAVISSVSPAKGSTNGGTVVTIAGNGFVNGSTTVTINSQSCDLVEVTLSQIKCTTMSNAAGSFDLIVVSNGQTYGTETFNYTTDATPAISTVNPTFGTSGTPVTISGSYFGATNAENTVTIGGVECTVTSSSPTQIQCTAGAVAIGSAPVVVDVTGSGLSNNNVMFEYRLTVSAVNKNTGSASGGQTVTVSGSGFDSSTSVTICGLTCVKDSSATQTASQYVCVTPAASGTVVGTQACDVVATTNGATQTLSGGYTYDQGLTPSITSVNPPRGGTGGGVTLTIAGSGFGINQALVDVTIAGTPCTVTSVTDNQILCTTGQHTPSQKTTVRVEINGNGIADQTNAGFYYVDVWSSPFTWGGGSPPEDGTLVVIPAGNVILLDQNTNRLKMVLIKGGELIFDEKDVELFADNILIVEGGKLQIGTEDQPFQHKAIITGTAHLRTKELPIYGTNSIGVRDGILDLHGQPTTTVWTRLGQTAAAGSRTIVVEKEVDWKTNDEIVIASTGGHHSQRENEKHTIASVAADKKTITLTKDLDYQHLGTSETISGHTLEYRAEVGLLTRNIVLRGERDPQWTEVIAACPAGFNTGEFATQTCFQGRFGEEIGSDQFGLQVMLHPPEPNKDLAIGRVSYVEFTYVGQAFRLGRYPFHFHLIGNTNSSYIKGCALHETFNRAVNIHGTHNALVENNVIYNVMGGAFFLEDGIETGNAVQYNLAVFVRESTSLLNDDVTPASFWVTNPNNIIQHNSAAGGSHFGFWYRMHPHPEGPSRTNTICPQKELMGVFTNNTAHSFGWFGLWIFETFLPKDGGSCGSSTPAPAVFNSLYAWNCDKGAESVNTGAVQFHDFIMVHNRKAGYEQKKSLEGEFYTQNGPMFKNGFIVGRSPILSQENNRCTTAGIVLPYFYRMLVDGTEFANFNENGCAGFSFTSITGTSGPDNGGFEYHTENIVFTNVGANNRGRFRWEHEAVMFDRDGSLTGTVNATVVPTSGVLPPSCSHFEPFSHGKPASKCPPGVKFVRFSNNNIKPTSIEYKEMNMTNQYGWATSSWQKKRMTHPKGWMVLLPEGETYVLEFVNAEHLANMSFNGMLSLFGPDDHVIFSMRTVQKPDCVLLGNGVCVNETLTPLDGAVDYHGDWSYDDATQRISYIISMRNRPVSGRRKKRSSFTGTTSLNMNFRSYKCFYENCVVPPDPSTLPPPDKRPDDFVLWSNASTWPNNTLPVAGDSVTIDRDVWRVGDTNIPPLAELILYGVLELDHGNATIGYRDFVINTTYLVILGGRLIIGWENNPFLGNAHILLQGHWFTNEYFLPVDDVTIGSKVIGVYGGLDLHGKPVTTAWTTLNATVEAGETTITVTGNVDWQVGNEIVIAPTGYKAWETETFKINAISSAGDISIITLNDTIRYRHLSFVEPSVTIAAEVGLLTRNIKIEGADYDNLYKQSFGGRILVGESSHGRGYARISNVEFYHMGQEGYIDSYDPRFAVAFVDSGPVTAIRPSYIKNNAFHHGFSPAIGVYNAPNMPIEDNVIHHCVYWSLQSNSDNTQIRRNMVTLMVWEGSYQDRAEPMNVRYNGAISALEVTNLVLEGNRVSGSERVGYAVRLHECTTPSSSWYSDNVARSNMIGYSILPSDKAGHTACNRVSGFTVLKNTDMGVYYQSSGSVIFENLLLADNRVGIVPIINGPASISHTYTDKTVTYKNIHVIGTTNSFDCQTDKTDGSDDNIKLSPNSRTFDNGRRIGLPFGAFISGPNKAPEKPFVGSMSYQAIAGLTKMEDVTFSNFSNPCSVNDYAIATNNKHDDGIHPIESRRLTFNNVAKEHRIFLHRPNVGKINSADCVDMDCDGLKKAFLKDEDGSLLGSPGAVIPQSEWQWGGDPRRGLGDYRVPKTMQTKLDGTRIPMSTLAPIKGVIRDKGCVLQSSWQAYECHRFDYEMLIIESMDSDTETRRLSPVAVLGHDEDGDGVLDLINGPQDHGWCSGYTCRKRLSTFQAIVATGQDYLIHFTSTTPQKLRYMLINSDNTQAVGLSVWYSQPYRLDVYYNGNHIMPTNGRWKGDAYILDPPPVGQPMAYKPNVTTDAAGTNWFDRDSGILYFIVKGNTPINVRTVEQVIINFQYPALTVDEFYGEKIVEYLAAFFDLPPEKVRVVDIVPATQQASGRRRKRSTGYDEIIIEVSDQPSPTYTGAATAALTKDQLEQVYAKAVAEGQLGNFSAILNGTVLAISIAEPTIDPSSPEWGSITTSDGYRVVVAVDHLDFNTKITPLHEGTAFKTQPKINAFDVLNNRVNDLGTTAYPWYVTASIRSGTGNPSANLIGNTTVQFVNGWANFSNLGIDYFGTGFIIDFNITSPEEGENVTLSSDPIDIPVRPIKAVKISATSEVYESTFMAVTLELRDDVTEETIPNIAWRGHTWNVAAEIGMPALYNGSLEGVITTTFDTASSQASFYSLNLTMLGMTVIKFRVTSSPADYDFYVEHMVPVRGSQHMGMVIEETTDIVMKVDADYTSVVGSNDKHAAAMFGNWFANAYPDVRCDNVAVSPGSIMVTMTVSGSNNNVNSTLYSTCSAISNGQSFTFNGNSLTLSTYMTYNGTAFYGVSCNVSPTESDSSTNIAIIVAAVCCTICLIVVIVVVVLWKCKVYPKTKTHDEREYGTKYLGNNDLDEILFREKTFMSITNAPVSTSMDKSHLFPTKY